MAKLKMVALWFICIGIPVAIYRITPRQAGNGPAVTYSELVTIVLTCLTIALALFAVIVGIVAVWGYSNIKTEAGDAARSAVESTVKIAVTERLNEEALRAIIRTELMALLPQIVREEIPQDISAAGLYSGAFPQAPSVGEEPSERIADDLPGENNETR